MMAMRIILYVLCFANVIGFSFAEPEPERGPPKEFRSDYTYHYFARGWFKVHPSPVDWHTARLICHYEGAELVSPLNDDIMAAIKELVSRSEPKLKAYFTGVHSTLGDGVFTSIDGTPLEKFLHTLKWDINEPNNEGKKQQCLAYTIDGMRDFPCEETLPYICFRPSSGNDELTECGTVDKEYKLYNKTGHCYKQHKNAATWPRAQTICQAEGGYLAVINSQLEASVLREVNIQASRANYAITRNIVSIGFLEWGHKDSWMTVLGQTLDEAGFVYWDEGQPDNFPHFDKTKVGARQSCGGFKNGKLDDIWCDEPYGFICEKSVNSLTREKTVTSS